MTEKPWRQLACVLSEAALVLVASGVLFIVISRLSGPALLGTYALGLAWLTLFQGLSSFGVPEFIIREVGALGKDAASQIVHATCLQLGSGLVGVGLMIGGAQLLGYSTEIVAVISIASLALVPISLTSSCRSVFLALREMHRSVLALSVEVTITMVGSLCLLLSGHGAIALMVMLVIAKCISAAVAVTMYCRLMPSLPTLSLAVLAQTVTTVFAFGLSNIFGMMTMRINTIMVSAWVDVAVVGQFAAATKIMEIGLIVPQLFAQLLQTHLAHGFNRSGRRDPNRYGASYELLFALLMPIAVGGWLFARPILDTLFGAGFGNAVWVLRILMIYLVIEAADAQMSVILRAAHRQREDVARLAFNPLTNVVLNLLLLPILGTIGAAIGRVGGVLASTALRNRLITRKLAAMRWGRFAAKPLLISLGVALACYPLLAVENPAWVLLLYGTATAALLVVSSGLAPSAIKELINLPYSRD